jgi:hypothetical protein
VSAFQQRARVTPHSRQRGDRDNVLAETPSDMSRHDYILSRPDEPLTARCHQLLHQTLSAIEALHDGEPVGLNEPYRPIHKLTCANDSIHQLASRQTWMIGKIGDIRDNVFANADLNFKPDLKACFGIRVRDRSVTRNSHLPARIRILDPIEPRVSQNFV